MSSSSESTCEGMPNAGTHHVGLVAFPVTVLLGILALVVSANGCSQTNQRFADVVRLHVELYPQMEIQDLYKLTFHAAMGNDHLMTDTGEALRYLQEEFGSVQADSDARLVVMLSPDGQLVRLDLRAYKARYSDPAPILQGMIRTAEVFTPSPDAMEEYWQEILEMASNGTIPFRPRDLTPYWEHMRSAGYPAVHHSEAYHRAYAPSYRVLIRETLRLTR